ncbi:MAG: hypothetical protein EBR82_62595 [Caulobacteraceae bacterium]|nr:hypothetical protein [Caulobacteraceae bacterium]
MVQAQEELRLRGIFPEVVVVVLMRPRVLLGVQAEVVREVAAMAGRQHLAPQGQHTLEVVVVEVLVHFLDRQAVPVS